MEAGEAGYRSGEDEDEMSWWDVTKRVVAAGREHGITDWAAALTYYSVLALFPALIALVSILGLVGASATDPLIENLTELTPGTAAQIITDAVEEVGASRGTAGIAFVLGILGALWSASGYVGAFGRATNAIYGTDEGRPFWKLRPLQIAITTVLVLLLAASAVAVVVTGPLAEKVGDTIGAGDVVVTTWDLAKWPVITLVVVGMVAILYYAAPNVHQPGLKSIAPGAGVALLIWILASLGFAIFVANFAAYNATYGSLAGVIVFLVWLWLSNLAVLAGAEVNAELERHRELRAGVPPEETLALPPREAPTA
jgi:membrane protein